MRAEPCPQEERLYPHPDLSSVPPCLAFPLQQVEVTGLLKVASSVVKGWMVPRSPTDSSRFICVSTQHAPLVLRRVKRQPAPISADTHVTAGYFTAGNHRRTAPQPSSTAAKMGTGCP